jgi:Zn-finger nucleic acid-binding protein
MVPAMRDTTLDAPPDASKPTRRNAMNCPRCERTVLEELDRDGLVVDRCPSCRGMWLDRGELEKLIARAGQEVADLRARHRDWDDDDDDDDRRRHGGYGPAQPHGRKRRWFESFGEIFD